MIIGIEGTGSQDWDNDSLRRSFVRKVLEQSRDPHKYYFIGPDGPGSDGHTIVDGAWKQMHILGMVDSNLILVGYSRGAAYCMKLAEMWLKAWGNAKPITMVLFDAVARNKYSDSAVLGHLAQKYEMTEVDVPANIPGSVSICLHAVRNPMAGSRAGFGNVGLDVQDRSRTSMNLRQDFMCSHGAMGGTSYDAKEEEGTQFVGTYAVKGDTNFVLNNSFPSDPRYANAPSYPVTNKHDDDIGMEAVGTWMWGLMKRYGIVPPNADPLKNAQPFNRTKIPGVPYLVR